MALVAVAPCILPVGTDHSRPLWAEPCIYVSEKCFSSTKTPVVRCLSSSKTPNHKQLCDLAVLSTHSS